MGEDEEVRLNLKTSGFDALKDVKQDAKAAADAMEEVAPAVDKAEKSTKNLGYATLTAGRGLQDFAQGGIGGVLNNIEGLSVALGGGPGLAGVLTAVGVAAYIAIPALKNLWREVVTGSNDVPKATEGLAALTDEIKANKDRLKELADQQHLTNAELTEYNTLTAETTQLEEKANTVRERRNALEAARKQEGAGNAESAAIVKAALVEGGGTDAVVNEVQTALQQSPESRKAARRVDEARRKGAEAAQNPLNVAGVFAAAREIGAAVKALKETEEANRAEAESIVVKARGGDEAAIRRLASLAPGGSFGQALPENIRAQNDEVDADAERAAELHASGVKRRKEAAKVDALNRAGQENEAHTAKSQQDAQDKLTDDLNDQGRANEEAFRKGLDRDAAKQARESERERTKAEAAAEPGARLRAFHDQAFQAAAGMAIRENNGEFAPAQLEAIAREAANTAGGLDVGSIRQAVTQAAYFTRLRIQADLNRKMMRLQNASDSYYSPY